MYIFFELYIIIRDIHYTYIFIFPPSPLVLAKAMREWQKENADKDPLSNSLVSADEYASALQVRETLAPSIGKKRNLFTVA